MVGAHFQLVGGVSLKHPKCSFDSVVAAMGLRKMLFTALKRVVE